MEEDDDNVELIHIVVQNTSGGLPSEKDLERYKRQAGLEGIVLGDHEGEWIVAEGANGGTSQHSYAILNWNRTIAWSRADGGSTTLREVKQELENAE